MLASPVSNPNEDPVFKIEYLLTYLELNNTYMYPPSYTSYLPSYYTYIS